MVGSHTVPVVAGAAASSAVAVAAGMPTCAHGDVPSELTALTEQEQAWAGTRSWQKRREVGRDPSHSPRPHGKPLSFCRQRTL